MPVYVGPKRSLLASTKGVGVVYLITFDDPDGTEYFLVFDDPDLVEYFLIGEAA